MLIEITTPTPVLNTPDFSAVFGGKNGDEIPLDERGLPLHYEFVALKGATFQVSNQFPPIYQVSCSFYPKKELYIDSRFTKPTKTLSKPQMPNPELILERMEKMIGTAYVWGGNWSAGIPEMLKFYPPARPISHKSHILWTLKGVDCSGLLYEATQGASLRNTSQLVYFGEPVTDLSQLKPLDMIVYPGHILFVFNAYCSLESLFPHGVVKRNLAERLDELLKTRQFVDRWESALSPHKYFTIRRFI